MKDKKKKMIAPIVITCLVIIYYVIYFAVIISLIEGVLKFLLGVIPFAFAVAMIYVCVQRINEIQGGEEDDLSKY